MSHALTEQTTRKFFNDPTVYRFKAIQTLVLDSVDYDPSAAELLSIEAKLTSESPIRLLDKLDQLPSTYQICPRFHYVEARIRESLGEIHEMQQSVERLRAYLTAIVEAGDGCKDSPFAITFMTDEDDVVRSFGEKVRYQQILSAEDRQFDVVTAHSSVEFWFDVTSLMKRTAELQTQVARVQEISQ